MSRNEAETCADLINPQLAASGWGVVPGTRIRREYYFTQGRLQTGGRHGIRLKADYVLEYKGQKLAIIEAKKESLPVGEGVAQAKEYAEKMHIEMTYASNGLKIYQMDMGSGREGPIRSFPTPDQLWQKKFAAPNPWRDTFNTIPFEDVGGSKQARYYQETAVNKVMAAIADDRQRILLTLATGTGKTFIAFQIAWKLFHTRWNLRRDGSRRPRILFLADRNILADQAYNAFNAFPEDALVRIRPDEIRKKGRVPTNGSLFFTIFQTFMSGTDAEGNDAPYFGGYPRDFFDFIVIDECHRGGANDESNWRAIMEYFSAAVQLGLTATPKRKNNVDTYAYFGEPVYVYSLKEGINDGFLTPFKLKRIQTTLDEYVYTSDDFIVEGEIEAGKIYTETDFNRVIEIRAREAKRVKIFLDDANQRDKAIIFCAIQDHAAAVRDLINQNKDNPAPKYCVRVTANDGALGEQYLREFQDNEKTIPTILTTSQKLSTGVDARNIRNIVLMRPINSMIEFKQIIGRGTRLFEGKDYFTIYDFVGAYHHFSDPEWDGEPIEIEETGEAPAGVREPEGPYEAEADDPLEEDPRPRRIRVKLADGKEREIQHMIATSFWSADGHPISAEQFLRNLFGALPEFFTTEAELRQIWSSPGTRRALLDQLDEAGYGKDELSAIQRVIDAENSDIFDVLEYISFAIQPITRERRVAQAQSKIFANLRNEQKEFVEFVLAQYIETGVDELAQEKLPDLLRLKYQAIADATGKLGPVAEIRDIFIGFQQHLYQPQMGMG
ncbi:MAG: DEAD/DEAH box helicase family protein [Gammaproteobacteria bacterium]|nr:DEAD/DEAH box helicase family protein [Gammaproteobacteria bacterium]